MALVEFINDSAPYINAENLNNNFNEVGKYYSYNTALSGGSQNVYFRRYGHIVEVDYRGDISSLATGGFTTLLSDIPQIYRPNDLIQVSVERSVTADVRISINTDGTIQAYNYSEAITQTTNFQFRAVYLVD